MTSFHEQRDVVLAVTGASGAAIGLAVLDLLCGLGVRVHLVVTQSGKRTLLHEAGADAHDGMLPKAYRSYDNGDIGATIASGSFRAHAMVVAPCSMRTLAAVAHGLSDNLITRAADVTLKERRRLLMMVRETPFNLAHLRNMTAVTEMGGIVFPPLPAFYHRPASIEEMVDHTVARVLEMFDIVVPGPHWEGT